MKRGFQSWRTHSAILREQQEKLRQPDDAEPKEQGEDEPEESSEEEG